MTESMKDALWIALGCVMIALAVGVIVWMLSLSYTEFMNDCRQHHPHYVCRTMYRNG